MKNQREKRYNDNVQRSNLSHYDTPVYPDQVNRAYSTYPPNSQVPTELPCTKLCNDIVLQQSSTRWRTIRSVFSTAAPASTYLLAAG